MAPARERCVTTPYRMAVTWGNSQRRQSLANHW